jgi:type II secretory pathway pseudopilin PulG
MRPASPSAHARGGFTLIEVMLASIGAAMILVAVYVIFARAIKLRDGATQRVQAAQVRERAVRTIRNDLQNAFLSGGVLAATLDYESGGADSNDSAAPGYFKFTATTGHDTPDDLYGDVEQVEYYIAKDGAVTDPTLGGRLVRVSTRDLLEANPSDTDKVALLHNVTSFQVSFYDGTTWQDSWQSGAAGLSAAATAGTSTTSTSVSVPEAIRIDIQQAAPSAKASMPPPLEITVPWTTQPFAAPTATPSATSS